MEPSDTDTAHQKGHRQRRPSQSESHSRDLSLDIIARGSAKLRRRKDESLEKYAARITHLKLPKRHLHGMSHLNACKSLVSLYLYENAILKISNLGSCRNLAHLYLQSNRIDRLEGISHLKNLSKLFIGANRIVIVEGLHQLPRLRELHIENQSLPPGEKLLFDPRTLIRLSESLRILNVAGNGLTSVQDFSFLRDLRTLDVSNNRLTDLMDLGQSTQQCMDLVKINVKGNPFCLMSKYEEELVTLIPSLTAIDDREFNATQKRFLTNWKAAIEQRRANSLLPPEQRARRRSRKQRPQPIQRQGVTITPRFRSRLRPISHSALGEATPPPPIHSTSADVRSSGQHPVLSARRQGNMRLAAPRAQSRTQAPSFHLPERATTSSRHSTHTSARTHVHLATK